MTISVEQKAYLCELRTTGKVPEGTRPDFNGLGSIVQKIEETAIASNGHLRSIENTIALLSDAHPELADLIKEETQEALKEEVTRDEQSYPPLPPGVALEPGATEGLCPLKDEYVKFSTTKSPEGFEEFHSSCFWSMLSTVAGRRIAINLEGRQYTQLTVMLAARSTLYAKTETAEVTRVVLKACGLDWLLGLTRVTPQKLLLDMAGPIPENYSEMSIDEQDKFAIRLAMSAQRGWLYNEFGKLVKSMMQSTGPMAEFSSVLLQVSDCPDELPAGTVGRGNEIIVKPYLSILGTLTPASIKAVAGKHTELWSDGSFARILWSCPPPGKYLDQPFKRGSTDVPKKLKEAISEWHEDLGEPRLKIVPIMGKDKDGNEQATGRYRKEWAKELNETILSLSDAAYKGWVTYRSALKSMIAKLSNYDLDASYGRLNTMALRVAALAASLEDAARTERTYRIEYKHWMLGQEQAEMWRASLHQLYAQVNTDEVSSKAPTLEDRVLEYIERLQEKQSPSARDIARYLHMETLKIEPTLASLVRNGVIKKISGRQSARYQTIREEEK